jgi:hypothetical protein
MRKRDEMRNEFRETMMSAVLAKQKERKLRK